MYTMNYFLYKLAPQITGYPIQQIRFDCSYQGYKANNKLCDSKVLHRHFLNDLVDIKNVNGNIVEIDII